MLLQIKIINQIIIKNEFKVQDTREEKQSRAGVAEYSAVLTAQMVMGLNPGPEPPSMLVDMSASAWI